MFPWNLARIIVAVNVTFLYLVALPLAVYLVIIVFQTLEIGATRTTDEHAPGDAHASPAETAAETIAPRTASIPLSAAETNSLYPETARAGVEPALPVVTLAVIEPITAPAAATLAAEAMAPEKQEPAQAAPKQAAAAAQAPSAVETTSAPAVSNSPEAESPDELDPILPEGTLELGRKGSPKYAFDYRGRLWVEKKNKGFFRQLRRPHLPPEDPGQ